MARKHEKASKIRPSGRRYQLLIIQVAVSDDLLAVIGVVYGVFSIRPTLVMRIPFSTTYSNM